MTQDRDEAITALREAYKARNLTLYLGAGVSIGSGLPIWEPLILTMYFQRIIKKKLGDWRPYTNYLYAIVEWHLKRTPVPLEITARKIRKDYPDPVVFLKKLRQALYAAFCDTKGRFQPPDPAMLCNGNPVLGALAYLIRSGKPDGQGIKSVITYNFDDLLEMALQEFPNQPIYSAECSRGVDQLPIYHPHGFVPLDKNTPSSTGDDIVFTEDQYHRVAQDPYAWSNIVQLQALSSSTGLLIGLSLNDRNIRRLLEAVRGAPVGTTNYALFKKPEWKAATVDDLKSIHMKAQELFFQFQGSGIKSSGLSPADEATYPRPGRKSDVPRPGSSMPPGFKGEPVYQSEIRGILGEVERFDKQDHESILKDIGIQPIFLDTYEEIPAFIADIAR